ncbi:hypothetical protein GCM10027275_14900 [Rhabdobacter roseus]|uniref:ThuA-like domain-containing protein n=1 Tax=Rhabdobacter roseus TaxID=1655419 RepID=A0A840TTU1_9BACT|nr:ThuA domain-containing protein [Rhabdobacter roseus]MBB5283410.1 hypothetical protein [Rhabdobacter roseus]
MNLKFIALLLSTSLPLRAQPDAAAFRVIAFFTARHDAAHVSFVWEANRWFAERARQHAFTYDTTSNWNHLNADFLARYQVVLFLDTRPEVPAQREAFRQYMERGGAWMGFHFAAFALTPSTYPQNWDWYHQDFLGSGEYRSNTWRPTSAVLRVENRPHAATAQLPDTFRAAPNEWYSWQNDLRAQPDIQVLLSVDPASFPLGTGPKSHEIWHSGYYPVAWTHKKYRMIYLNMGHNDLDYENKTNRALSSTFQSKSQNLFILNSLQWLGSGKR